MQEKCVGRKRGCLPFPQRSEGRMPRRISGFLDRHAPPGLSLGAVGSRRFVITPKSVSFLSLHISVKMEDGNNGNAVVLFFVSNFFFLHLLRRNEIRQRWKTKAPARHNYVGAHSAKQETGRGEIQ